MLLEKKEVIDLLRCPKSGSKLTKIDKKLISESSTEPMKYNFAGDCPVLIDFKKGLLKKEGTKTLIDYIGRPEYNEFLKFLRGFVSPLQKETVENIDRLTKLLLATNDISRVLIVGGG